MRAEGAAGKIPVAPHVDNYVSVDPERSAITADHPGTPCVLREPARPRTTSTHHKAGHPRSRDHHRHA